MTTLDSSSLASETYALAASSEPIAALVKEALEVIDAALDEYGCAAHFSDSLRTRHYPTRLLTACLLAQIGYLSASMVERTVRSDPMGIKF